MRPPLAALLTCLFAWSCASTRADAAREDDWLVLVRSCRLPEEFDWYARFAHHHWIDVRDKDSGEWRRIEVRAAGLPGESRRIDETAARSRLRWQRTVETQAVLRGEEARRAQVELAQAVARRGARYADDYQPWPGPNSNTFVRELCDDVDGLAAVLDHNAIGKDHDGWIGGGAATSETGVRGDIGPLGLTLAAREGVKLRVLALEFGVQAWPPALHLPVLPPIPWSARPDDPRPPEAESSLVVGDSGLARMEQTRTRTEAWSTTWLRNDASSWIHVACAKTDAGWRIVARTWDGERVAEAEELLADGAGVAKSLRLAAAGLDVRLDLRADAPGTLVERAVCLAGLPAEAERAEADRPDPAVP
jgi:hypothetical protein